MNGKACSMKFNRRVLAAGIAAAATLFLVVVYAMPTYLQAASNAQTSKIAFSSLRDGHAQLYMMDLDGSNQANISNNAFNETQPVWSPDGSQIAFVSDREGNPEICTMAADGSNAVCLTHNGTPNKKLNAKLPRIAVRSGRRMASRSRSSRHATVTPEFTR